MGEHLEKIVENLIQTKRAWLVDIPLAVHAHQNKTILMTPND